MDLEQRLARLETQFANHNHDGLNSDRLTGQSSVVTDADIVFSDITTGDVSTSKHGFAPKAPNDATKFLNGLGAYSTPPAAMTLIHAGSGTNTNLSANNLDTASISGLTALDVLIIHFVISNSTIGPGGGGGVISLYHATDAQTLIGMMSPNSLGNGVSLGGHLTVQQNQDSDKNIFSVLTDNDGTGSITTGGGSNQVGGVTVRSQTVATAWTSAWTLALRGSGVGAPSGVTLTWSWKVYKLAGQ